MPESSGIPLDPLCTGCHCRHITCFFTGHGAAAPALAAARNTQHGSNSGARQRPRYTEREVLKCEHCKLVQFSTPLNVCRRCKQSLLKEQPRPQLAIALVPNQPAAAEPKDESLQVANAVRDLRRIRNLSQRQLAGRMGVPRTYISKIENAKAMPTLSSLDRLARALQVDISALLRDAPKRHQTEADMLTADPFLAEMAKFAPHLTPTQKSIFLNHVREMAQTRSRRTA